METFFPRDLITSESFRLVWTLFQFSDKVHARRDYTDAVKAASLDHKDNPVAAKNTIAYQALKRIGTIYDLEGTLKDLSPEERLIARQTTIKPLVVINFDECFTTRVGDAPGDIKAASVCGQYLEKYKEESNGQELDIQKLISREGIEPSKGKSKYKGQIRYAPGTIVKNGNYLLMAFAKLDENGRGNLTYTEYLDCLDKLWEQIDIFHGTDDVYLPILGSRITYFDKEFTQQELLDIMINSYSLSSKKMKEPNRLHIICKERSGFSINGAFGVE